MNNKKNSSKETNKLSTPQDNGSEESKKQMKLEFSTTEANPKSEEPAPKYYIITGKRFTIRVY